MAKASITTCRTISDLAQAVDVTMFVAWQLVTDPRHAPGIWWIVLCLFVLVGMFRLAQPTKGARPLDPRSLRGRFVAASRSSETTRFSRATVSIGLAFMIGGMVFQS